MKLGLSQDSLLVKEMFERFFMTESTPARVRAAEPVGFDPGLWRALVALDAPSIRVPASAGGGDTAQKWIEEVRGGETVLTLALQQTQAGVTQLAGR
jgi:hypothetical protein